MSKKVKFLNLVKKKIYLINRRKTATKIVIKLVEKEKKKEQKNKIISEHQ